MGPAKKQRVVPQLKQSSRIFQPYRAIGHVTTDAPFCLQQRGTEYFLTVPVGNAFQIYDCAHFHLKFVSPATQKPITALAAAGDFTFAACGGQVLKFHRSKLVGSLDVPGSHASVTTLAVFGEHLIAIYDDNKMRVWDYAGEEVYGELEFGAHFSVTQVLHPSTYLNKILLASNQGTMQLWNIRTR